MNTRLRIRIPGVVQGAGFRPWVYRLAVERGISGFVRNIGWGVAIEVQAESAEMIESFLGAVSIRSPRHSWRLESLSPIHGEQIFRIAGSEITDAVDPVLSPDVGICEKCRTELWEPGNRRYQYPFISCAECGPRQSITFRLPFDRAQTSWSEFSMCPSCELEYADCRDRRFHAQTISCPNCGPRFAFLNRDGQILAGGNEAIEVAAQHILHGEIIAIKGVGGFHLFVDASNESAVKELRRRKLREDKPFALMVASSKEAMRLARWSPIEMSALYSREAPIVLVRRRVDEDRIAQSVAPGLNQLGIMLASTGLHSLLLFKVGKPVVATRKCF
jgi:hydrogenase maturation protein HypF